MKEEDPQELIKALMHQFTDTWYAQKEQRKTNYNSQELHWQHKNTQENNKI